MVLVIKIQYQWLRDRLGKTFSLGEKGIVSPSVMKISNHCKLHVGFFVSVSSNPQPDQDVGRNFMKKKADLPASKERVTF